MLIARLFLGLFNQFTQSKNFIWNLRNKIYKVDYTTLISTSEKLLISVDTLLFNHLATASRNNRFLFLKNVQAVIVSSFLNSGDDFQSKIWINFQTSGTHVARTRYLLELHRKNLINEMNRDILIDHLFDFNGQTLEPHWLEYLVEV